MGCISFEAILVTILLFFVPRVISDDTVPVPADKAQVASWFESNVPPVSGRQGLDPALAAAESKPPKIINVKADGSGDFKTIQQAIDSVPEKNAERVVISIGPGNYTEKMKIPYTKPFITMYGDPTSPPNLIFNGDAKTYGTVDSATLIVESDYFQGVNLNVINTTPAPDGRPLAQALALRATGDRGAYYKVKMFGFQDTLCDDKGVHLFKDCYIEGTVDYIFGNARSIYLNTEVKSIPGLTPENVITAHARDDPNNDVGFSFLQCSVTGTAKAYLGRTWRSHPKVVFAFSDLGDLVIPKGWSNNNKKEFEATAFFGEFSNRGPGSDMAQREPFVKKLTDADAKPFLSLSFINATSWLLPPTKL